MVVWAISVVGIVILTVLSDVILPEGETSKYIKTVVGIVAVLVLVSPLPSILSGDLQFSLQSSNNSQTEQVQHSYLEYVCNAYEQYTQQRALTYLADNGYGDCTVQATYKCDYDGGDIVFQYIDVYVDKSVINGQQGNINITEDIRKALTKLFAIEEQQVRVYV